MLVNSNKDACGGGLIFIEILLGADKVWGKTIMETVQHAIHKHNTTLDHSKRSVLPHLLF